MSGQKIAKSLPKRAASSGLKERRKVRWASGKERKAARIAKNEAQAKANAACLAYPADRPAPTTMRNRIRPRKDNMRTCLRCEKRQIVAGSVCWCQSLGVAR